MENVGTKLMTQIRDLSELEVQKLEIQIAKFNKEISEYYETKISTIEENIDSQIKYYGKNISDHREEKDRILNKYKAEFQKNYDKRKEQFFNIQVEIQELQANQKIAFANFKKVAEDRTSFLESSKYVEYISKKQEFQRVVNSTVNREEFEKYSALLENLKDPLDTYTSKLEALINKYAGYDEIILECEAKLTDCILATKKDFDEITKYRNSDVAVAEGVNFITNLINKILNKFAGKTKFEKDVIQKMESELIKVEQNNIAISDSINEQTIYLVAKIEELRDMINSEFNLATNE